LISTHRHQMADIMNWWWWWWGWWWWWRLGCNTGTACLLGKGYGSKWWMWKGLGTSGRSTESVLVATDLRAQIRSTVWSTRDLDSV